MIFCFLLGMNGFVFLIYGLDKYKAVRHKWRISEAWLILLAAMGGAAGALFGMLIFHHKTRKPKFYIGVPVLLAVEGLLLKILLEI